MCNTVKLVCFHCLANTHIEIFNLAIILSGDLFFIFIYYKSDQCLMLFVRALMCEVSLWRMDFFCRLIACPFGLVHIDCHFALNAPGHPWGFFL